MNNIVNGWYGKFGKRFFDIALSFVGLIILSPIIAVITVLQLMLEGRPIFFSQERIGLHGTPFKILKFRSMSVKQSSQAEFSAGDSTRVTRLGKVLRKSKLDEIPQLYCVLKGDMSLVGPRPEIEKWTKTYATQFEIIHSVRPGITDPIALSLLNEEEVLEKHSNPELTYETEILPMKIKHYLDYVSSISLTQDLRLLVKTVVSIIFR